MDTAKSYGCETKFCGATNGITSQSSSVRKSTVFEKQIFENVHFCAVQGIAFRAHLENRSDLANVSDINRGNFLELLSLGSRDDPWLQQQLAKRSENSMSRHGDQERISPSIQNECIDILGGRCLHIICDDARNSGRLGLIVDEAADISRTEQVSMVLRYSVNSEVTESFIGFCDVKSTTGRSSF